MTVFGILVEPFPASSVAACHTFLVGCSRSLALPPKAGLLYLCRQNGSEPEADPAASDIRSGMGAVDIANEEKAHSVLPAMQACHLGPCLGSSPRVAT